MRSFAKERSDRYCDLNFDHYGAIFRGGDARGAAGYARNARDHFYKMSILPKYLSALVADIDNCATWR